NALVEDLLACEVIEERGAAHADPRGDVLEARLGEPARGELLFCGAEQAVDRLPALRRLFVHDGQCYLLTSRRQGARMVRWQPKGSLGASIHDVRLRHPSAA